MSIKVTVKNTTERNKERAGQVFPALSTRITWIYEEKLMEIEACAGLKILHKEDADKPIAQTEAPDEAAVMPDRAVNQEESEVKDDAHTNRSRRSRRK